MNPPPQKNPAERVDAAEFEAGATALEQFPPPIMSEVAFAGRSNVGKSSMMNRLLERNGLVRTSSKPGCTRQVSWFAATFGDKASLKFVDLPGYGYAKRSKTERKAWAGLIEGYLSTRATLKAVVILVDIRRGIEEEELELIEFLETSNAATRAPLDVFLVATKLDKLSRAAQKPALEKLRQQCGRTVVGFSAVSGTGRERILRRLRRAAGIAPVESNSVD